MKRPTRRPTWIVVNDQIVRITDMRGYPKAPQVEGRIGPGRKPETASGSAECSDRTPPPADGDAGQD